MANFVQVSDVRTTAQITGGWRGSIPWQANSAPDTSELLTMIVRLGKTTLCATISLVKNKMMNLQLTLRSMAENVMQTTGFLKPMDAIELPETDNMRRHNWNDTERFVDALTGMIRQLWNCCGRQTGNRMNSFFASLTMISRPLSCIQWCDSVRSQLIEVEPENKCGVESTDDDPFEASENVPLIPLRRQLCSTWRLDKGDAALCQMLTGRDGVSSIPRQRLQAVRKQ